VARVREHGSPLSPDELVRLRLNGRATDAKFAQNPLPIARAMGRALGELHGSEPDAFLGSRTNAEASAALAIVESGAAFPEPFSRVKAETLTELLKNQPQRSRLVPTHGAPVVRGAVLTNSVVVFDDAGTQGLDPAERDLAIAIRSVAETFTSEVAATLLDGYLERGGELPHGPTLDWYGVVAAFR